MAAVKGTWRPPHGKNCDVCDYPATHTVSAGNGSETHVCDNHVRYGSQITDGDHHTYMVHPNAYLSILQAA